MESGTMRMLTFFLAMACIAPAATATTLYRCPGQGTNGATLIQDKPCPDGRAAATQLDSSEIRVSAQRQRELDDQRRSNECAVRAPPSPRAGRRTSASAQPPQPQSQRRRQACTDARNWRDAQRRSLGLKRNYEILSQLDRKVSEACKGVGP